VVFNASTGINPQSGQLANTSATDTMNNGLPPSSYSEVVDGARGPTLQRRILWRSIVRIVPQAK
jgi:hypothetical protein